jgi:glycine cleavage system aminomethyltransferase T
MLVADPHVTAAVGPRVRTSPYFDATVRAGLTAVSCYNHMWLPMSYGDPDAEYERLVNGVSMWDVAAQRHVAVGGPDADRLVQTVTAIDTTDIGPGTARYAPIVDHEGTLINDPILLRMADGSWRFSIADSDVRLWIDAIAHGIGLDCTVAELDTATLAIQGPRTCDVLEPLGLAEARDLGDFEMMPVEVSDIPVVLSRSGWSNQGGVELFLDDPTHAERLWEIVADAGAPAGIGPGAPNPAERLESVLLSYGTDTGYDADPIEIGLEDHLDIDGPEFIGQAALRAIAERGPARRLVGAVIDGDAFGTLPRPVPLTVDGDVVGELRSGVRSPRFGRNIGLALVAADTVLGTVGDVCLPDGERRVELVSIPFEEAIGARGHIDFDATP